MAACGRITAGFGTVVYTVLYQSVLNGLSTGRTPEFAGMPESQWPELLRLWMADLGYLKRH